MPRPSQSPHTEQMPRPIRTSRDAERSARDALRSWGYIDADLTRIGADHGIDVASSDIVAQVKAQTSPVGAAVVREIFGVSVVKRRVAACFSLAGFTPAATKFAKEAGVALFAFDLAGEPSPLNSSAVDLMERHPLDNEPERSVRKADWVLKDDPRTSAFGVPLSDTSFMTVVGTDWGVVTSGDREVVGRTWDGQRTFEFSHDGVGSWEALSGTGDLFDQSVPVVYLAANGDEVWVASIQAGPLGAIRLLRATQSGLQELLHRPEHFCFEPGPDGVLLQSFDVRRLFVRSDGLVVQWPDTPGGHLDESLTPIGNSRFVYFDGGATAIGVTELTPPNCTDLPGRVRQIWLTRLPDGSAWSWKFLRMSNYVVAVPIGHSGRVIAFDASSGRQAWTSDIGHFDDAWATDVGVVLAKLYTLWALTPEGAISATASLPLRSIQRRLVVTGAGIAVWASDVDHVVVLSGETLDEVSRIKVGAPPSSVAYVSSLGRLLVAVGTTIVGYDL